jgi:hypothetical protein
MEDFKTKAGNMYRIIPWSLLLIDKPPVAQLLNNFLDELNISLLGKG